MEGEFSAGWVKGFPIVTRSRPSQGNELLSRNGATESGDAAGAVCRLCPVADAPQLPVQVGKLLPVGREDIGIFHFSAPWASGGGVEENRLRTGGTLLLFGRLAPSLSSCLSRGRGAFGSHDPGRGSRSALCGCFSGGVAAACPFGHGPTRVTRSPASPALAGFPDLTIGKATPPAA